MKRISEEKMASVVGGAGFWKTVWQCRPEAVRCKCRKVYHRLWTKSHGAWQYNMSCALDGLGA